MSGKLRKEEEEEVDIESESDNEKRVSRKLKRDVREQDSDEEKPKKKNSNVSLKKRKVSLSESEEDELKGWNSEEASDEEDLDPLDGLDSSSIIAGGRRTRGRGAPTRGTTQTHSDVPDFDAEIRRRLCADEDSDSD